jgi:hypothetical protein
MPDRPAPMISTSKCSGVILGSRSGLLRTYYRVKERAPKDFTAKDATDAKEKRFIEIGN